MAVGLLPVLTDDPMGESTPVLRTTENAEMLPTLVPAVALSSTKAKRGLSVILAPQPARTHNNRSKPRTGIFFFGNRIVTSPLAKTPLVKTPLVKTKTNRESLIISSYLRLN